MSEAKCNDAVFGEMTYRHRWYKEQEISIFGQTWNITVAAKAYSGKAITNEQQDSYVKFMENERKYIEVIENELKNYVNNNLRELAEYWATARYVDSKEDLAQMVTPKTLLFKQDGTVVLLLDCVWDVESGVGVKIIPEVSIGVQDLFL
ncbi:MAG: hypothetical protein HDR20_06395 [Lachnospiraceae bacterium]|nr:hypothetical protein [Lachnospiraceae bacterium]